MMSAPLPLQIESLPSAESLPPMTVMAKVLVPPSTVSLPSFMKYSELTGTLLTKAESLP